MKSSVTAALAPLLLAIAWSAPVAADADALDLLQRYIELDTTNPPGNESRGVDFFREIFDAAGIEYDAAQAAPGRGNIWARLKGGDEPALILLHHMDVVPATASAWDTDPLRAVLRDGRLAGRGSLDTKALGIAHLEAFLALQRSGLPFKRDVIFVATADEEAGGRLGAGWLVEHRPEIFAGAGFLLNEGGIGIAVADQIRFQIEVAQKRPYWLRLVAHDEPGHGSSPHSTSAPGRLIAALSRIQAQPFAPRIVAPVRDMLRGIADYSEPQWRDDLGNIDAAIAKPDFLARFQAAKPRLHALLRNTCSITVLSGSGKVNVVPAEASAELDCRILPDEDAPAFLAAMRERIADDQVRVEVMLQFSPSQSSPDTDLFRLLRATSVKHYPTAGVLAAVAGGFTDSHFFRERGIVSYGYAPFVVPATDLGGVHGNNERIEIETFKRGVVMMSEIVATFATQADGGQ